LVAAGSASKLRHVIGEGRKAEPAAALVEQIERRRHRRGALPFGAGASEQPQLPATNRGHALAHLGAMSGAESISRSSCVCESMNPATPPCWLRRFDIRAAASSLPIAAIFPPSTPMSAW